VTSNLAGILKCHRDDDGSLSDVGFLKKQQVSNAKSQFQVRSQRQRPLSSVADMFTVHDYEKLLVSPRARAYFGLSCAVEEAANLRMTKGTIAKRMAESDTYLVAYWRVLDRVRSVYQEGCH